MRKIKVEDYTPDWAHGFNELREAYLHHLTGNFKVVHVGSTSVPGMAARAIVDIDIIVSHPGELVDLIAQLTYLGYLTISESEDKDVVVLKRSIREVPLLNEHHSKWVPHHLNLCLEDSLFYKCHQTMKDYLMSHEKEIESFGDLKKALSHKHPKDLEEYQKEKETYIHEVLKAEGFKDDEVLMLNKYQFI